ncbi:HARE-HTH domain-containing protein [Chloropicon primus]|nr:HARE-HTH domain-containing protein [Chloropicon primus]
MRASVNTVCSRNPRFVRTALGTYAIATDSLNGSNAQVAVSAAPLRDAIYRFLQDVGGSLHYKEIQAKIQAKKLYVFRRMDGSLSFDQKAMWSSVRTVCSQSPLFVRTEPGTYAIAKDLRKALESGLMTEKEYAQAVQQAQRYES